MDIRLLISCLTLIVCTGNLVLYIIEFIRR